jgi:hypothetical protein
MKEAIRAPIPRKNCCSVASRPRLEGWAVGEQGLRTECQREDIGIVWKDWALLTDLGLVQGGKETELSDGEPSDESTSQHHPSVHGRGLENTTQDEPKSSDKDYQGRNIPVNFRLFPGGLRSGRGNNNSLAVLLLSISAANEAGIQPQKAPSKSELEMNPIQFPLRSSWRSMTRKKSSAGSTPAMTPRSYESRSTSREHVSCLGHRVKKVERQRGRAHITE